MSAVHTVTLKLPIHLYNRFRQRADKTHRAVEIELLEAVAAAAPNDDDLPADLAQQLAEGVNLPASGRCLWRALASGPATHTAARVQM